MEKLQDNKDILIFIDYIKACIAVCFIILIPLSKRGTIYSKVVS